jgi:hypothetical protein
MAQKDSPPLAGRAGPVVGVEPTRPAHCRNEAIDPIPTCGQLNDCGGEDRNFWRLYLWELRA